MENLFKVNYQVDDGYVGKARPHDFLIDEADIIEDMTEDDLRILFSDLLEHNFRQSVYPVSEDEDKFVMWAKEVQERLRNENS